MRDPRPQHPQPRLFGSVATFEEMHTGPGDGVGARFILWLEVGWERDEQDTGGKEEVPQGEKSPLPPSQPVWGVLTPLEICKTEGPCTSPPGALGEGSGGFHSLGTWRDQDFQSWGREVGSQSP